MKKYRKRLRTDSSGQLLVVAALAIAILISSTTIYVYEVSKETNGNDYAQVSNLALAIKQSTRNSVISSLSNVSNGGEKTILSTNLDAFSQILRSLNRFGTCNLVFTVFNDSNYDDGIRLSWNTSDEAVSSAYSNFTLKIYGEAENLTLNFALNITTAITVSGYYSTLGGNEKQVNLTCNVYNEREPALTKNFTFSYENLGTWMPVNSSNNLSVLDFGNGTYHISFTVSVPSNYVQVSTQVQDLRNIFVKANATCYEA